MDCKRGPDKVALRHAVLAALTDGEASGYELSKRFDISVANFWPASSQQIYRELERLEKQDLLEARLVEQTGRPNKRIFNITDSGHLELQRFIEADSRPTAIRDDLLVKLVALDQKNIEAVEAAVRDGLEKSVAKLELYLNLQAIALGGRSQSELLSGDARIGSYLALLRGISFEEGNQAWSRTVLEALARRRSIVTA